MKTIKSPNPLLHMFLGAPFEFKELKYIENPYVIKEGDAWYNTFTEEAVLVKNPTRDELIKHWFLIPDNFNIIKYSDFIRSFTRVGNGKINSFIIFTTTACNASCEYCFEKGVEIQSISPKRAKDIANYIIRVSDHSKKVMIKWFGGEPLCNKKAITDICHILQDQNIRFVSDITTNGSLLTSCTDEELVNTWKLKKIQLTFDDIGNEYDRIKGLKNGSYEEIKTSIVRLTNLGIKVTIRIHYNPEKPIDTCFKIIDEFKDYKKLSMYPHLIYDKKLTQNEYEQLIIIENYLISIGKMWCDLPKEYHSNHCMADGERSACITPNGFLVPCEHYVTDEIYGSIYDDGRDENLLEKWKVYEKHTKESCKNCQLYPSCKKIIKCPAEGKCEEGYCYYRTERIKRALRKKVSDTIGHLSNGNAFNYT